ncbi:MAG: hypothetical protein J6C19_05665 [Lachnospiraceae bacterium]|nr:hypothetical protein [Lachnospiraceae bacterium]
MPDSEIRVGKVSSINYESGMARVTYRDKDDSVTAEFPILTNNDEYRMPQIGQEVIVAHLSNGSSRGAIIGSIWNKKYEPYEAGEGLYRKELSRKKDAAYIRYSDETGEYLIKVANLHLNGIHRTILDGPRVEISANISMLLESENVHIDTTELLLTGGDDAAVNAQISADINISQEENVLEAVIREAVVELIEDLEIKAGTSIKAEADEKIELLAGGSMRLKDNAYDVTLTEIMKRLEALEG